MGLLVELEKVRRVYVEGGRSVCALGGTDGADDGGLDLKVEKPGFYGIMGPSGSGKTTLMHLIAGLDRPDGGKVVVAGQDLAGLGDRAMTAFRRRHVGVVFQQFNLIGTLTARENVGLPGVLDRRPRKWVEKRTDELLARLGLRDRAEHRPDALSGGEQQRVAIARALLFDPPLLLADEPTGNLDSATSERLWGLLGELAAKQEMVVLMVTHEPAAAVHCERVFVLRDGICVGSFEVDGMDASDLARCYQDFGRSS